MPPLFINSWKCNLCHLPIKNSEEAILATWNGNHRSKSNVYQQRFGQSPGETAFPYHLLCVNIQSISKRNASLVRLGQALGFALPVDEPPAPEHALQLLARSCYPTALPSRVTVSCDRKKHCICLACLLEQMSTLPTEIFSKIIFLTTPSYVQNMLLIFGETSHVLSELEKSPAGSSSILCRAAVFETRIEFGGKSYITGLYNQEVRNSKRIKSDDVICKYVVVWSDKIGITNVDFVYSQSHILESEGQHHRCNQDDHILTDWSRIKCKNCLRKCRSTKYCLSPGLEREWVYAVTVVEGQVCVKSKGVFLERITNSTEQPRKTLWDCSEPLKLFQYDILERNPFATCDILRRYVTLLNVSAISVAFCFDSIYAIMPHVGQEAVSSLYAEMGDEIVWTHCPLKSEDILAIWVVRHKNRDINLGARSLLIETKRRLFWLGGHIGPGEQQMLDVVLIACNPVCTLYYNDPRMPFAEVGAIPPLSIEGKDYPAQPQFPIYRTCPPQYGVFTYDSTYSEASLEGVDHIQSCEDAGYCIGLLLQYTTYSTTVGQFRYDKEISDFCKPHSIVLVQEQHSLGSRVRIKPFDEQSITDEIKNEHLRLTEGILVWWYGRGWSTVTVESREVSHSMH